MPAAGDLFHELIAGAGLIGEWLLVAGPVYQAGLDLRQHDAEKQRLTKRMAGWRRLARVSPWWWLVPPVKVYLEHRRTQRHRAELLASLSRAEVEALIDYLHKASGWLLVGTGAGMLAFKDTVAFVEARGCSPLVGAIVAALLAIITVSAPALRIAWLERIVHEHARTENAASG